LKRGPPFVYFVTRIVEIEKTEREIR